MCNFVDAEQIRAATRRLMFVAARRPDTAEPDRADIDRSTAAGNSLGNMRHNCMGAIDVYAETAHAMGWAMTASEPIIMGPSGS